MGGLKLRVDNLDSHSKLINIVGDFSGMNAIESEVMLHSLIQQTPPGSRVILEFGGTTEVDMAAVGVLYKSFHLCQQIRNQLILLCPGKDIRDVFIAGGVDKLIEIWSGTPS